MFLGRANTYCNSGRHRLSQMKRGEDWGVEGEFEVSKGEISIGTHHENLIPLSDLDLPSQVHLDLCHLYSWHWTKYIKQSFTWGQGSKCYLEENPL